MSAEWPEPVVPSNRRKRRAVTALQQSENYLDKLETHLRIKTADRSGFMSGDAAFEHSVRRHALGFEYNPTVMELEKAIATEVERQAMEAESAICAAEEEAYVRR